MFVHGLGGHRYNTWSKNNVFWPRDLLSRDFPDVRVITFGYDSVVVGPRGRVGQNQIHDHAKALIADLQRCRKNGEEVRCRKPATRRSSIANSFTRIHAPLYSSLTVLGGSW